MEKNINIINSKNNILEMDIEIDGINSDNKKCFFVIETKEVNFSFKCVNTTKNTWTTTIPKMPQIENTLYNFYIYMVIDGYYFEPYSGTINVMKSNEVYVKDISNKTFESTKTLESTKLPLSKNTIKSDLSILSLTKKILNNKNPKTISLKEQKIKEILKESKHSKLKKGKITEF